MGIAAHICNMLRQMPLGNYLLNMPANKGPLGAPLVLPHPDLHQLLFNKRRRVSDTINTTRSVGSLSWTSNRLFAWCIKRAALTAAHLHAISIPLVHLSSGAPTCRQSLQPSFGHLHKRRPCRHYASSRPLWSLEPCALWHL